MTDFEPPAGGRPAVSDGRRGYDSSLSRLRQALPAAIADTDAEGYVAYGNGGSTSRIGHQPVPPRDTWRVTWPLRQADSTALEHEDCPRAAALAATLRENCSIHGIDAAAERPEGSQMELLPLPMRDETGALTGAVNKLVDLGALKAAEAALRASEERYRLLSQSLEARVAERTDELEAANQRLQAEVEERQRAEAALHQAQKMEAIGQLAAGMAHDFNNLLTAILGNLELIEIVNSDERVGRRIEAATKAALRGAQLNQQMLAFCRKQHLSPSPVDLGALIGTLGDMLSRTLGGTIQVMTRLEAGLWPALVDPSQIELVILNLALNARDAMPCGGTVHITAMNATAGDLPEELGLAPGDYVRLSVTDDGVGMPEPVRSRACEPFFTTKQAGQGSGLGLSQVYGVARQSGGDIVIASAVGRGTTVDLYLPRSIAEGNTSGLAAPLPTADRQPQQPTILVVDDQPDVREIAAINLEDLGYQVLQAGTGKAALAMIEGGAAVDLLIADYAMAEMTGVDLALVARRHRPGLPVLIVTGYLDVADIGQRLPDSVLLKKPYRARELASAVEKMLAEAR